MIKRWEEIQTSKERLVPTLETELSIKAALFRGAQSSPAVRGSMIGHLIPSLPFSYLISQHHGAGGSLVPIFLRRRLWHGKVKYTHFFWSSACWQSPASNPSPPDIRAPAVSHSAAQGGSKTQPRQWARMSLIKQPCWSTWFHRKRFPQCCVATDSLRSTLKLSVPQKQSNACLDPVPCVLSFKNCSLHLFIYARNTHSQILFFSQWCQLSLRETFLCSIYLNATHLPVAVISSLFLT